MGAGLPAAIEAARLHPRRRVMAICGDGGFMMNSQELETAMRLGINLVILILRDNAYGMIRWKQYAMGLADFGLEFGNPDFSMYAESYGARGHRVESADAIAPLLEQCYAEGGVHLVDIPVDYSENQKVLVDELQAKVLPALTRALGKPRLRAIQPDLRAGMEEPSPRRSFPTRPGHVAGRRDFFIFPYLHRISTSNPFHSTLTGGLNDLRQSNPDRNCIGSSGFFLVLGPAGYPTRQGQ